MSIEQLRDSLFEVPSSVKKEPVLLIAPSILLTIGVVLDEFVAPLFDLAPLVNGVVQGIGWGVYLRMALKAAGGVEHSGFGTSVVCMIIAFVGSAYGGVGILVPVIFWLLPVIDYSVMYAEGPDGALAGTVDTLKDHGLIWLLTISALLVILLLLFLLLHMPMSIYSTYAHRDGAWLAGLTGGILVGPLVHLAVLFRGRLFLALHGDPV